MAALLILCALQDVDGWIKRLRDDDAAVRKEAVQKLTDAHIKDVEKILEEKEKDLLEF